MNKIMKMANETKEEFELIYEENEIKKYFNGLYTLIKNLLILLWEDPKIFATFIMNTNKLNFKKNLSFWVSENFYGNELSSNYKNGHLLYMITLILKKEINDLNFDDKSNNMDNNILNFLNNTSCSLILSQLYKKIEIKPYFKKVLFEIIQKFELIYSPQKLSLDPKLINSDIFLNNNFEKECEKESKMFKYYLLSLNKEELEKFQEDTDNQNMKEYISMKLEECSSDPHSYSTESFLKNVTFFPNSKNVLIKYRHNFIIITKTIDDLFKNLLENIQILPNFVKCLCKIISLLIKKQNPSINNINLNCFIAKFFFVGLFLKIIDNPSLFLLINEYFITDQTIYNLKFISLILLKFISGKFYKNTELNGNYTPFNRYFLEKMPKVLEFFKELTNVDLPSFITKIINDQEEKYDYFKENPNEINIFRNICFNTKELVYLIYDMGKCKEKIFKDDNTKEIKATLDRLLREDNQKILKELSKNDITQKNIRKYFLLSDIIFNKNFSNIFENKTTKDYFFTNQIHQKINKENQDESYIIQAKDNIYIILSNYKLLCDKDFKEKKHTKTIFYEIGKNLEIPNSSNDNFSLKCFINPLINCLHKLPTNFKDNEYKLLYDSLEIDIRNSIQSLNSEEIVVCNNQLKVLDDLCCYYKKCSGIIKDFDLNEKVQYIIRNLEIYAELYFKYEEGKEEFLVTPCNKNNKIKNIDNKKYQYICNSIDNFIGNFPDLNKKFQGRANYFELMEKDLKIPIKLENYFSLISEQDLMKNEKKKNEIEYNIIYQKICDYIMEKLYTKIFPIEKSDEDIKINENCAKSSWVEPKHFIQENEIFGFENFLPWGIKNFEQIEKEKIPRKKIECVEEIFKSIDNLTAYNTFSNNYGYIPLLNYMLIKAKPNNIDTNRKYISLFIDKNKFAKEGIHLKYLKISCDQIKEFSYDILYQKNITKEEYEKNCKNEKKEDDLKND